MQRRFLIPLLLGAAAAPLSAQQISAFTVDGGGGRSSAAGYQLHGSVGQPDAARSSAAGYVLEGGFWAGRSAADVIFADGFQ